MSDTVRAALAAVVDGGTLERDEAHAAMGAVMDGEATPAQLAALLVALRMRGETVDELAGFAEAMRERVAARRGAGGRDRHLRHRRRRHRHVQHLDGRGARRGRGRRAGRQARQPGHHLDVGLGRRARGARRAHRPDADSAAEALRELGFAFLFAPGFHPAMRHAGPTRREIGVRTAFNLLGPHDEPGRARRQVVGVGDRGRRAAAAPRCCARWARSGRSSSTAPASTSCRSTGAASSTTSRPAGVDPAARWSCRAGVWRRADRGAGGRHRRENAALVEAVLAGDARPATGRGPAQRGGRLRRRRPRAATWRTASRWRPRRSTPGGAPAARAAAGGDGRGRPRRAPPRRRCPHDRADDAGPRHGRRAARPRRRRRGDRRPPRGRRRRGAWRRARTATWPAAAGAAPAAPRRRARASPRPGLHLIAEVKRSSPSAGAIAAPRMTRRPGPRLRGRRRRRHLRPLRAALVRRVRGRPARRPGRGGRPGARQGVRRRRAPAARPARRRRGPGPAARRRSTRPAACATSSRAPATLAWSRSSRSTTSASSTPRWRPARA